VNDNAAGREGKSVLLRRCVFDSTTNIGSRGVILDTSDIAVRPTGPITIDPLICEPIGRGHCQKTWCTGTVGAGDCAADILIADCMYVDVTDATTGGGAIRIRKAETVFTLLRCQFFQCGAEGRGGGVWFEGKSVAVSAFYGVGTYAKDAGTCCSLTVANSGVGTVELNESTSLLANGPKGTFHVKFTVVSQGKPATVLLLNATGNSAPAEGSALGVAEHWAVDVRLCQFYSNYDGSTLQLSTAGSGDALDCVVFYNNTCTSTASAREKSLIVVVSGLAVGRSVFYKNTATQLVRRPSGGSDPTVTFTQCVFDEATEKAASGVVAVFNTCDSTAAAAGFDAVITCAAVKPARTPLASAPRTAVQTAARTPIGTPARTAIQTPARTAIETPKRTPAGTPARTPVPPPQTPTSPAQTEAPPPPPPAKTDAPPPAKTDAPLPPPPKTPTEKPKTEEPETEEPKTETPLPVPGGLPGGDSNAGAGSNSGSGALIGGIAAAAGAAALAAIIAFFVLKRRKQPLDEGLIDDELGDKARHEGEFEAPDTEYIEEENPYASSGDAAETIY
jgi:outer membrane biosynthesis protein TonB